MSISAEQLMKQAGYTTNEYMGYFLKQYPEGTLDQAIEYAKVCAADFAAGIRHQDLTHISESIFAIAQAIEDK